MKSNRKAYRILLYSGLIVILSLIAVLVGGRQEADFSTYEFIKNYLFVKGRPRFDLIFISRSFLILIISLLILKLTRIFFNRKAGVEYTNWDDWGKVPFLRIPIKTSLFYGILTLSALVLMLAIASPEMFYALAMEDNVVENASAGILLIGAALLVRHFVLVQRINLDGKKLHLLIVGSFAALYFLIAMEEVSWFQRAIDVETPDLLTGNRQGEMNFHNYFTRLSETGYYFAAFVLLIFLPYAGNRIGWLSKHRVLSTYIPGNSIMFCSAIIVALNYNLWDNFFTQLAFFITMAILIPYFNSNNREKAIFLVIMLLITQSLYLIYGKYFIRQWDLTEYKELFIPIGFLLYAIGIGFNLKKKSQTVKNKQETAHA